MSNLVCPVCGSPNLTQHSFFETISESLGGHVQLEKKNYICAECGSEGDLFSENEEAAEFAIAKLREDLVVSILEDFTKNNVSLAAIERALELPQRTLTKWKTKSSNPSAAGVSLLKFLKIFPWLLEVAENGFEYGLSQKLYLENALKTFMQKMAFEESGFRSAGVITTANTTVLYFQTQKNGATPIFADERVHIEARGV